MSLIGVDRAAKGGFVEALRMLIEDYGADYLGVVQRNGETLAHSAAMNGHIEVLKYLKSKGMNLHTKSWESVDFNGAVCGAKRAVDWVKYYYQSECVAFSKLMRKRWESTWRATKVQHQKEMLQRPLSQQKQILQKGGRKPAEEAGAAAQT